MARANTGYYAGTGVFHPDIRTITPADLGDALARGLDDFKAWPSHAVFLCIIYPIVAFGLARAISGL
ncbi:MAG TPA: hypothetical protein VKT70_13990, partial [Stellaceae bacterium]|nr:hypothetical protein [Stellaceae bacterium]